MRLIDADARIDDLMERYCKDCDKRKGIKNGKRQFIYEIGDAPCRACEVDDVKAELEEAPTIDAVPVGAYEQTRWERDTAISQLEEIGKSLCEKMDNVATVVRCKDCKHWGMHKSLNVPWCFEMHIDKSEDGFCDIGERREDAQKAD